MADKGYSDTCAVSNPALGPVCSREPVLLDVRDLFHLHYQELKVCSRNGDVRLSILSIHWITAAPESVSKVLSLVSKPQATVRGLFPRFRIEFRNPPHYTN